MPSKRIGYGSEITVTTTTGETMIGQVRSISGPGVSIDDIDTTCLDSTSAYRTFAPGLGDPGEVTFELVYSTTIAMHKRLALYMNSTLSSTFRTRTFKVYHGSSTGDSDSFAAYVKGLGREIPLDDLITAEVTLKVSGKPGYTT